MGFERQSNEKKKKKENKRKILKKEQEPPEKRLTGGHWVSQARWCELNWGWRMTDSQAQEHWTLTEAADRG